MKILLVIPDGVGFRNFILTRFVDKLMDDNEVMIWHTISDGLIGEYIRKASEKVIWYKLPHLREGQLVYIMRRSKQLAQLFWQNESGTEVILEYMNNRIGSGLWGMRNRVSSTIAKLLSHSHSQILILNELHRYTVEQTQYYSHYLKTLEKYKPDIIFCSHQRSEVAVPIMLAARQLNIPTVTFIFSWDNLPKGRMAVYADYYFVWSQHMKDEMRKYYPDIHEENVFIVGTPQFENYFNPQLLESRETFFSRWGLDLTRPVICFSGDDLTTSPYDPDYLADLADAMRQLPQKDRPQILFRRNPTDMTKRYEVVLEMYPEIRVSEPAWVALESNDWSKVIPTIEDTKLLVNVVNHCDLVVNVASTMALDFAILGKPCIYLYYNPSSRKPSDSWSIEKVYRYPHFNHLKDFSPVYWARSRINLARDVIHALYHPEELQVERERWVEFLVQPPFEEASTRIAFTLKQLATNK